MTDLTELRVGDLIRSASDAIWLIIEPVTDGTASCVCVYMGTIDTIQRGLHSKVQRYFPTDGVIARDVPDIETAQAIIALKGSSA